MRRISAQHTRTNEQPRPIAYVGDNLDRLLGLLDAARVEQQQREWPDREASYLALAEMVAYAPRPRRRLLAPVA